MSAGINGIRTMRDLARFKKKYRMFPVDDVRDFLREIVAENLSARPACGWTVGNRWRRRAGRYPSTRSLSWGVDGYGAEALPLHNVRGGVRQS